MPLSIAERLHQLPHGAQAAVAEQFELSATTISAIMRGAYPRPGTEPALSKYRAVQTALAERIGLPVWEVFAEWDGERPTTTSTAKTKQETSPLAKVS